MTEGSSRSSVVVPIHPSRPFSSFLEHLKKLQHTEHTGSAGTTSEDEASTARLPGPSCTSAMDTDMFRENSPNMEDADRPTAGQVDIDLQDQIWLAQVVRDACNLVYATSLGASSSYLVHGSAECWDERKVNETSGRGIELDDFAIPDTKLQASLSPPGDNVGLRRRPTFGRRLTPIH